MAQSRRRFLGAATAAATSAMLPTRARAEVPAGRNRSIAETYRIARTDSNVDAGGAIIGINKPQDEVLAVTMKFRRYHRILPRLQTSRMIGRRGNKHDVYMRAPILKGMYHIWAVSEFVGPLDWRSHGKRIVGKMKKGNVRAFDGAWKMHPCGPNRTILRLELFMIPKVPVPDAWITPELMWAAGKGVTAVRDMAECRESSVKND